MNREIVLTVTGPDRVGIVEAVSRLVFDRGGNVETSRMARLGGEFAILMLATLPSERVTGLDRDLEVALAGGYKVTITPTRGDDAPARAGWTPYQIELQGADHEGIVHEVARYLSARGINIESMDTETAPAPVSGTPLFLMTALVLVPPGLDEDWEAGLEEVGERLNLDIEVMVAGEDEAEDDE